MYEQRARELIDQIQEDLKPIYLPERLKTLYIQKLASMFEKEYDRGCLVGSDLPAKSKNEENLKNER